MESYEFEAKRDYRRQLWSIIDRRSAKPRALRTAIYLDTREALETIHLLQLGYKAGNLLAPAGSRDDGAQQNVAGKLQICLQ